MFQHFAAVVICHPNSQLTLQTGVRIFDSKSLIAACQLISASGLGRYSRKCYYVTLETRGGDPLLRKIPLFCRDSLTHKWRTVSFDFDQTGVTRIGDFVVDDLLVVG